MVNLKTEKQSNNRLMPQSSKTYKQ